MNDITLSNPLCDIGASISGASDREQLSCPEFFNDKPIPFCLATWHSLLHALTAKEEVILTCVEIHNAEPVAKLAGLVSELNESTTFNNLLSTVSKQYADASNDLDSSAQKKLREHGASHSIFILDSDTPAEEKYDHIDLSNIEIALIREGSGWCVNYASAIYSQTYIEKIIGVWAEIAKQVTHQPEATIAELSLTDSAEKIRAEMDGPVSTVQGDLVTRFAGIAESFPDKIAVKDENNALSYQSVHALSDHYAALLIDADVQHGDCVGVAFNRNIKMVVAQLAVLKAGAVFVPMDAEQPADRLLSIAEDASIKCILTEDACSALLQDALSQVTLVHFNSVDCDPSKLRVVESKVASAINQNDIAYLIFTSGSTGRPKGVQVSHGNLLNFIEHIDAYIQSIEVGTQFAPFTFDASVAEIHVTLLHGGTLLVLPKTLIDDPQALQNYMREEGVTFAAFPPQYAQYLAPEQLPDLKVLLTAGSAPDRELIERWQPHVRYMNAYGPTETTILSTAWEADRVPAEHEPIAMGLPILNTSVRVVNRFGQVLPEGVVGELLIGGAGVAHGYVKQQQLSAKSFVEIDNKRWYKSGDLSCFNAQEGLVFVGRLDDQIKLRGHRLEPGEIETAIKTLDCIDAVAAVASKIDGQYQLAVFCQGEQQEEATMRNALSDVIPAWAMPNRIHWLESLPNTVNGKTDYKKLKLQLKQFEELNLDEGVLVEDLHSPLEEEVAKVWQKVLKAGALGREANFIHLGGDSLTSMVVASSLRHLGFNISSAHLLKQPVLADFCQWLETQPRTGIQDYSIWQGSAVLHPIQAWFFNLSLEHPNAFCQSLIFESATRVEPERLARALQRLTSYHDHLRARFTGWEKGELREIRQVIDAPTDQAYEIIEYRVNKSELEEKTESLRLTLTNALNINCAPLFRIGILHTDEGSRVVWVLHHLLTDTISHSILLEDLYRLYQEDAEPEQTLVGKSGHYVEWAERLREHIDTNAEQLFLDWKPVIASAKHAQSLDLLDNKAENLGVTSHHVSFSPELTQQLLRDAPNCYHQSAEELVLAASYLALAKTFNVQELGIDIEWYGRDEEFAGSHSQPLSLTRSVGWFTCVHPLFVSVDLDKDLSEFLIALKEQRANVAARGRDFYGLRYLCSDANVIEAFKQYKQPEVLFNFSGVTDRLQDEWTALPITAIEMGQADNNPYKLSIESAIQSGSLNIGLYLSEKLWPAERINELQQALKQTLERIIEHCCKVENRRWTPSDFPLLRSGSEPFNREEIDEIPVDVQTAFPLTDMQQTMLRHEQTYQVWMHYEFDKAFEEPAFRAAVAQWVELHPCLRTSIKTWSGGKSAQLVLAHYQAPVGIVQTSAEKCLENAKAYIDAERRKVTTVEGEPPYSVQVFHSSESVFSLVLSIHHIIHDGWSIELLLASLYRLYCRQLGESVAQAETASATLEALVQEQTQLSENPACNEYWSSIVWAEQHCRLPESMSQPNENDSSEVALYLDQLPQALLTQLRDAARRSGVTLNTMLLTGYVLLLRYLGGASQVRCGVIQSGRSESIINIDKLTGCCVNTLPLVVDFEKSATLAAIIENVNSSLSQIRNAAAYPLSKVVDYARTQLSGEIFDCLFNIESSAYGNQNADPESHRGYTLKGGYESTNYAFIFGLIETPEENPGEGLSYGLRIGFDTAKYTQEMVEQWVRIYTNILGQLIASDEPAWEQVQPLPQEEQAEVKVWNDTFTPYPGETCIAQHFKEAAQKAGSKNALCFKDKSLSYAELDELTDNLARLLADRGVGPEVIVGLVAERSLEMVIGILAILKAGGAYVPIDPDYPLERIAHILEETQAPVVMYQNRRFANALPKAFTVEKIFLDKCDDFDTSKLPPVDMSQHHTRQLAYVLYTSGSTGKPKGVMVEQRSIVRLVKNAHDIEFSDDDTLMITSAPGFDVTTYEIWSALLNGLPLVVVDKDTLLDPEQLAAQFRQHTVTFLWLVTPLFNQLIQEKPDLFEGVKKLMIGGDALSPYHIQLASQTTPDLHIINGYGPTENTSFSTYHFLGKEEGNVIPIGRPIPQSTAFVVNPDGQLLPPGARGELYVGGDGVARGYFKREALTAEKFVDNQFDDDPGKLYRTGDLVSWRKDGLIDFHGRIDFQIKIRGFRVELGEIETALLRQGNVAQALVLLQENKQGTGAEKRLLAFVVMQAQVLQDGSKTGSEELRTALLAELPDYMVPDSIVIVDAMPLNANGKVDRAQLVAKTENLQTDSYEVPATEGEKILFEVWEEVLGHANFGVDNSFYSVGGDSILAIQIVSRAAKKELPLTTRIVMEHKTIRDIVKFVRPEESAPANADFELVTLSEKDLAPARSRMESIQNVYPATAMQESLVLYSQRENDAGSYHTQVRILMENVDANLLHQSWKVLTQRHDILRTAFYDLNQPTLMQVVTSKTQIVWDEYSVIDCQTLAMDSEELLDQHRLEPFDNEIAPLWRLLLIWQDDKRAELSWTHHHALLDGWSISQLLSELLSIYECLSKNGEVDSNAENYPQFSAYMAWLQQQDQEAAKAYWREQLSIVDGASRLRRGENKPSCSGNNEQALKQEMVTANLGAEHTAALRSAAMEMEVTLSALMRAAWALMLSRYTGDNKVLFGCAISGRPPLLDGVESTAGLFINSLPCVVSFSGETTLPELLHDVMSKQLQDEEFGFLPLAQIQQLADIQADELLFESLLVVENFPLNSDAFDADNSHLPKIIDVHGTGTNNLPLNVVVYPGSELKIDLAYQSTMFFASEVEDLLKRLLSLLQQFAENPNRKVSTYSLINEEEKHNILTTWNDTHCTLPDEQSVYSLFNTTITDSATPETAVVCGEQRLSRQELHNEVCQLAHHLRQLGVTEGDCVAVTFEKDPAFIVTILSLLKIGAAYVPVAVDCPKARREFINKDADIRCTLTQSHLVPEISAGIEHHFIAIDECPTVEDRDLEKESHLNSTLGEQATAYVIYTSGTTGQPKGVKVSHKNIINFCVWCQRADIVTAGMATTQFAPFTFDASAAEIFSALLNGAELHLLTDDLIRDYRNLIRYFHDHNISFSAFPPPYLEQMPVDDLPEGMTLLTAGSAPSPKLVEKLSSRLRYINGYGPTETTVLSTAWEYDEKQMAEGSLPIGKPIINTQVYLLDQYQQLCPVGVVGEICIAGEGVCQGYLNRDDLNRENFIEDMRDPQKKMYRTGDLGRWLTNGDIEFAGRRDNQIKIRGYRIELSEIETQLLDLDTVEKAAVAVVGNESGEGDSEKQIFAWVVPSHVVPSQSDTIDPDAGFGGKIKHALKEYLPPYMIPQAVMAVKDLPLTANGKVDIKALPKPDIERLSEIDYQAPTTAWEKRLVSLWAETLKVDSESIGINANFFELGGHSLLATRLCNAIVEQHNIEIPIAAVFEHGTLAALAQCIQNVESPNKEQKQNDVKTSQRSRILPVARSSNPLPLSDAQRRLWFFAELGDSKEAYNMSGGIGIAGGLNIEALKESLSTIVQRHEVLRSNIKVIDGQPVQIPREEGHYPLAVIDLHTGETKDEDALIQKHLHEEQTTPFDLELDSLVRGRLLILGDDRYILINTLHHIVSDGWSMGVLVSEMSEVYAALVAGCQPNLRPLPIQYADYAHWQQREEQQAQQASHLSYWREQLTDLPTLHSLPLDYLRPAEQNHAGSHYYAMIDADLNTQLRKFCSEQRVTVFMALYACFSGLLSRYSGEQDIVVGTPTANRDQPEVAGLIGFFANTLVLRADLHDDPSFKDMLTNARQVVSEAYLHQALPFEQLVDELQPERDFSYQPLFQIMISMISSEELNSFSMAGVDLHRLDNSARSTSKFDLTLTISEEGDQLGLLWNYATSLFSPERIQAMSSHFVTFLAQAINNVNQALSKIEFVDAENKQQMLFDWNETQNSFPEELCVHELFEQQVLSTPEKIAARFKDESITYSELNQKANQLAHYLAEQNVKPGDRVGVLCQRSIEALVGILGTLKAGAAFVPMDTRAPAERLAYLIEDAGTKVVLTQASLAKALGSSIRVIMLDDETTEKKLQTFDHSNVSKHQSLNARYLTYVIYTSGSTGKPKGVGVDHRAVVNYISHMHQKCGRDVAAAVVSNPLSFDGIGTTFWQILKGVTLELLPEGEGELEALANNLAQSEQPLLFKVTPSHLTSLKSLVSAKSITMQPHCVVSGGETFQAELARYWQTLLPEAQFVNHYGPTEATIGCCHYFVPHLEKADTAKNDLLPIGRPMSNRKLYILDANQAPVPVGVIGELYIGGEGLAQGYLNRESLTSEKFIQNPFANESDAEQRLYRSGDLARYLNNGDIEYVGRIDHQVKIRGFRIECGEIENCLLQYSKLEKCAVIVHTAEGQAPALVAYVVVDHSLNEGKHKSLINELKQFAAEKLPDYMVPSAIVVLKALPLTSNGKLDRKALLKMQSEQTQETVPVVKLTSTERKLLPFWQQVLKRDNINVTDDFFHGGGHSLLAAEMVGLIRQNLKWDVPLRALFDNPTLQNFARQCEDLDVVKADIYSWLEDEGIEYRVFNYDDYERIIDDGSGSLQGKAAETENQRKKQLCIIDSAAEPQIDTIKNVINSVKSADMPQYFVFSDKPEKELNTYEQHGFPELPPEEVDIESVIQEIGQGYTKQLFRGEPIDSFDSTPMQKLMLNWKQREFKHAIIVNGYYSDAELSQAFLQVQREQELLCACFDMEKLCWRLYTPPGRALAKVVDLRFQKAAYKDKVREKLAEGLIQFVDGATLPYLAYWVRLSDSQQVLYFLNDHLIADKTAFDVLGNRLEMYLSGKWRALSRDFRDYVDALYKQIDEDNIARLTENLDQLYHIDTLKESAKKTRKALKQSKKQPLRVLDLRFKTIENLPIDHAFSVFSKAVFTLLGMDNFCMTLNYHSRRQQGNADYDQIGLFLDRIPFCVNEQSKVGDIDHITDFVSETGISFTGIDEKRLLSKESLMPEFGADILFNFLGEDSFEKIAAGVESKNINNLQDFYGILLEAYTVENVLYTRLVFRGSDKVESNIRNLYQDNIVEFTRRDNPAETGEQKELENKGKCSSNDKQPLNKGDNVKTAPETSAIEVNAVKKRFGDFEAVKGISFSVERGTCFGILGPNGAGKTTLLGMMEGITQIGEGNISLLGEDVRKRIAKVQPQIGVQLQHSNYFDFLNVEQLLRFYHELRGGKKRDFVIDNLLEMALLSDKKKARVEKLSGGQKQRLSMVIAMLGNPEVLFLDEPTSALDPHSRRSIWELIEKLKRERNITIVLTTHHMEEAERLCDELLIMHRGEVISQGAPAELIASLNRYHDISLSLPDAQGLANEAKSWPEVLSSDLKSEEGAINIQVSEVTAAMKNIADYCTSEGIEIQRFDVKRPSLEDVFMHLTEKAVEQ